MDKIKFFFVVLLFVGFGVLHAQWLEYESPALGNFTTGTYGTSSFHMIPDSQYIILSDGLSQGINNFIGNNIISLDIETARIRSSVSRSTKMEWPVIIPDTDSGWNIYFHGGYGSSTLGMIHIDAHGEFENEELLRKTLQYPVLTAGIPERGEVWFIGDRIYRLTIRDDLWSEFHYPEMWDSDLSSQSRAIFMSENKKTLFVRFKGKTIDKEQMMMLDLITGHTSLLIPPDEDFLESIKDIKEWKGHDGLYLILMKRSIWIYNELTGSIALYLDELETSTTNLMQTGDGEKLYLFGRNDNTLKIVNLEDKTIEKMTFLIEENWFFDYSFAELNRKKGQLITLIKTGELITGDVRNKPVIIDLKDFSLNYIPGITLRAISPVYLKDLNVLIAKSSNSPSILVYLDSGKVKPLIQFNYHADNWSGMDNIYPSLLNNTDSSTFCHLIAPRKREIHEVNILSDLTVSDICKFPYTDCCLIIGNVETKNHFIKYSFNSMESTELELPFDIINLFSDPSYKQIIGFNRYGSYIGAVQFIKSDEINGYWLPPQEDGVQYITFATFDPERSKFWICAGTESGEKVIYKLSVETYELEDSFKLPSGSLKTVLNHTIDHSQNLIYLINNLYSEEERELVIIDLDEKSVIKRITLQVNVDHDKQPPETYTYPCMIPIPGRNRLFIWDGNGSWSVDTKSMEVLYGEVKDDPKEKYWGKYKITQGIWDEEEDRILVIDDTYILPREPSRVLEFDLDTGEITREIELPQYFDKVFFPESKDKIIFLDSDESKVYTLHLDPGWENPATVQPKTNYLQFGIGDNARFTLHIKNGESEKNVTAYVWLITPNGDMLFMTPGNVIPELRSFPLILPANVDVDWDILNFSVPEILPEGFNNFNAVLINENGDRGPVGTWNFYVKD